MIVNTIPPAISKRTLKELMLEPRDDTEDESSSNSGTSSDSSDSEDEDEGKPKGCSSSGNVNSTSMYIGLRQPSPARFPLNGTDGGQHCIVDAIFRHCNQTETRKRANEAQCGGDDESEEVRDGDEQEDKGGGGGC